MFSSIHIFVKVLDSLHFIFISFVSVEKLKDQKSKSTVVSSESLALQRLHWPQELTTELPIARMSKKAVEPVEISIVEENGIKAIGYVARGIGRKHFW